MHYQGEFATLNLAILRNFSCGLVSMMLHISCYIKVLSLKLTSQLYYRHLAKSLYK